jgi:hypothetical protein
MLDLLVTIAESLEHHWVWWLLVLVSTWVVIMTHTIAYLFGTAKGLSHAKKEHEESVEKMRKEIERDVATFTEKGIPDEAP